jgi:hypothetical protein
MTPEVRVEFPIPYSKVKSWKALLNALHARSVIPVQPKQGGHYRSPYVFRGMSCSEWPLFTSLERLKSPAQTVEPALLRSFRKYAPRGTFARDSDWEALAVAQHNGLPTRLLDWSVSPLIAAHFATSEREHFGKDGVIWCVDVIALRDQILPEDVAKHIQDAKAAVFDVSLLEQAFSGLLAFDATRARFGEFGVFFEPPSLDARIANQTGILSAMNGPEASHQRFMETIAATFPDAVHRIIIHKTAKPEVRDMLDQNNIHERMLFPGLPGLCDWLKRYYGPAGGSTTVGKRKRAATT